MAARLSSFSGQHNLGARYCQCRARWVRVSLRFAPSRLSLRNSESPVDWVCPRGGIGARLVRATASRAPIMSDNLRRYQGGTCCRPPLPEAVTLTSGQNHYAMAPFPSRSYSLASGCAAYRCRTVPVAQLVPVLVQLECVRCMRLETRVSTLCFANGPGPAKKTVMVTRRTQADLVQVDTGKSGCRAALQPRPDGPVLHGAQL